jgi:hypothetical protein
MAKKQEINSPDGMVFLKPLNAEIIILDPVTFARLPVEGEFKKLDSYWERRIIEGVVITTTEDGE